MYVVTKNNPYYPSVAYFDNLTDAEHQRDEWIAEMQSMDSGVGEYECLVTIAKVIVTTSIRSDY